MTGLPDPLFHDDLRTAVKKEWGQHVIQEPEGFLTFRSLTPVEFEDIHHQSQEAMAGADRLN